MTDRKQRIAIVGLAALAVVSLSAALASAAQARAWYVNGAELAEPAAVNCEGPGGFTLTMHMLGLSIRLHAEDVECLEGSNIENNAEGKGVDSGRLRFTGVTVVEPAFGCTVPNEELVTNPLSTELKDIGNGFGYDRFTPAGGSEFITLPIEECVVGGEYPLEGAFSGKGNEWGTELVHEPLLFSPAVDAETGDSITGGGEPATLEGTLLTSLASGLKFGAK